MITVHYKIEGTVQGVGFRRFVLHQAHKFNLHGYVCNTDDFVECVAQGNSDDVSAFELVVRQGPPNALVTNVQCTDQAETKRYSSFRIV
jgi:acylphosphatase